MLKFGSILEFVSWKNDKITGYTLVEKRLSWVHTVQQREINPYDWSTPTFTPLRPETRGVYPAVATFLKNCTLISE